MPTPALIPASTSCLTARSRWLGGLGVYWDEPMQLHKMGTRYYDPALGRFMQVDPVAGGSANRYDYAMQDPLNVFGPLGQASIEFQCTRYEFTLRGGFRTQELRTARCPRRGGWDEKAVKACGKGTGYGALTTLGEEFSRGQLKAKYKSPKKLVGLLIKSTRFTPLGAGLGCLINMAAAERG